MALFTYQPVRIVIAGAGYAGLHAAAGLAGRLNPDRHQLTVVQPGLRFIDICRLHEAAVRRVSISYFLPDFLGQLPIQWIDAHVQEVNRSSRVLTVDAWSHPADIPFDILILASGSKSNDFGIPGVAEHAVVLKTLEDAERVRALINRVRRLGPRGTIAIVGAGLTGVELASEIAAHWQSLPSKKRPNITLIDAASRLLPSSSSDTAEYARRVLRKSNVDIRLSVSIVSVNPSGVSFTGGSFLPADGVVWCAGIGVPRMKGLEDLYNGAGGRIPVSSVLETAIEGIYAVGDQALFTDRAGKPVPPRAMYACQMGDQLARIIDAKLAGRAVRPFRPLDQGELMSLGRRDGAGYVGAGTHRLPVTGRTASLMKAASLQAHLVRLMSDLRKPILPEGSILGDILERVRG